MRKIFLFILLLPFLSGNAQKPSITKEPAWITVNPPNYNATFLDSEAEDGYIDLTYEKQVSLNENAIYTKTAVRIISEAGVQNRSELSVSFNPAYQQLAFHSIKVIRGTTVINQLNAAKIKTVHQENDLKKFIYNGSVDAILILEDIRKGDIIECSFTRKGFNPVFNNTYSDEFDMNFSTPLYLLYYKLFVPAGRKITTLNYKGTFDPIMHTSATGTSYEWKKTNVKAMHVQDQLPSWYEVYPYVMISEYESWKEVNDWALTLFPANVVLSKDLLQALQQIKANNKTDATKTMAALRFVQDEVRYMGIEIGINSHKPGHPDKIFKQRFGDCKEKSYLLCCMLRGMGIKADPVLINTSFKKTLHQWLPAANAFDHVTVRVLIDGMYYWFDPTISDQRGNIKELSYPDYQCGLVVTDTTTALTDIRAMSKPKINIKEVFTIPDLNGKATMVATTTYNSYAADEIRDEFKNNSVFEIQKKALQVFIAAILRE